MSKSDTLYNSVLNELKEGISNGKYPFKSKLPPENILATELNVSRFTIRKVLLTLKEEGLIETYKGKGSVVCNKTINRSIPVIFPNGDSDNRKMEILNGIQDFLYTINFKPLLTLSELDPKKEIKIINTLVDEGHKNLIIYPFSSNTNLKFYQRLLLKGINLVFVDTLPNDISCDYVSSCNFSGGYIATKKLIDLGHKKIAFCSNSDPNNTNTIKERFAGYKAALEQNKLDFSQNLVYTAKNKTIEQFSNEIINDSPATALFSASDNLAATILSKLPLSNKKVSIIGFDNSLIAQSISLSSIEQNYYELGKLSAELLYKRILQPNKHFEHIYIPVSLIERESSQKFYLNF